jgi:hypothetical protein
MVLPRRPLGEAQVADAGEVRSELDGLHLSRRTVDPDRALAVLDGVVDAADEVLRHGSPVAGPSDAR